MRDVTAGLEQELSPIPGEAMSLADIDQALEEQSQRFNRLMTEMGSEACVLENAERFREISETMAALKEKRQHILALRAENEGFERRLQRAETVMRETSPEITEWNESLVHQLVEMIKVISKESILVCLKAGTEIMQTMEQRGQQ